MSASLHTLIGQLIDPQPLPRQAASHTPSTPVAESLSDLIGRTMGPPRAARQQVESYPPAVKVSRIGAPVSA